MSASDGKDGEQLRRTKCWVKEFSKGEHAAGGHLDEKAKQRERLVRVHGRDTKLAIHAVLRARVRYKTKLQNGAL